MTDIPQELVDRVAEAFWNEGRCETNWSFAEMLHLMEDPDADVPRDSVEWIRGKARAGIAAMLDGVTLDLDDIHGDGSTLVVKTEAMMPITAMPCGKHHYAGTSHETLDAAKAAVFADYRARLLKAMTGQ